MILISNMDDSYNVYEALISSISYDNLSKIEIGKLLKELKQGNRWKHSIGDGIETWNQFLKQPEIGLTVHRANALIKIYENLIENMNGNISDFQGISYMNLLRLAMLPKVTDELIEQARMLSDRDFREVIVENNTPNYTPTYSYMVMRKCKETGSLTKVHGITSDEVAQAFNLNE